MLSAICFREAFTCTPLLEMMCVAPYIPTHRPLSAAEYYPLKDQDLRFFVAYIGRSHQYSKACGLENTFTNRIELGFMYRIKAY